MGERVENRVHHRGRGGDRAGLTHALHAERIGGAPRLGAAELVARDLCRRRDEVRRHVRRRQVAIVVVEAFLVERRGDALCDAAVDLPVDDQRIDDGATVVDCDVPDKASVAGLRVDLDDGGVRAARPGEVGRVVDRRLLEPRLHPVGEVVRRPCLERGRLDPHRLLRISLHAELTRGELQVIRIDLELVGGDQACLLDHLLTRMPERDAADGERAAAVGVHAVLRNSGVSVQHLDLSRVDPEQVGDDLRPRRLVSLPVRRGACHDLHRAEWLEPNRGRLPAACRVTNRGEDAGRRKTAHLVVGGEPDTELHRIVPLSTRSLVGTDRVEVEHLEQLVERRVIVAGVDRET